MIWQRGLLLAQHKQGRLILKIKNDKDETLKDLGSHIAGLGSKYSVSRLCFKADEGAFILKIVGTGEGYVVVNATFLGGLNADDWGDKSLTEGQSRILGPILFNSMTGVDDEQLQI